MGIDHNEGGREREGRREGELGRWMKGAREGGREGKREGEGGVTCEGPVSRNRRFMPEMVARSNISSAFLATELLGLLHFL